MASENAEYVNSVTSPAIPAEQKETVTRIELLKGGVTMSHSHPVEVMVIVVSGIWRFHLSGRKVTLSPNQVLHLPAGTEHYAEAVTDAVALNVYASWEAHCCSSFLPPQAAEIALAADLQHDPDQYLWGV